MPSLVDTRRAWGLASAFVFCLLATPMAAAQVPPAPTPPLPSPTTPADDVAARLKTQDDLIRQLAEQNRRLGEQLEAVTKRLDAIATPKPPTPGEPPAEPEPAPKPAETAKAPEPSKPVEDAPQPAHGMHAHSGDRDLHESLSDSLHRNEDDYGLKSIFDSLHPEKSSGKKWYDKLSFRGYTQIRFGRGLD